eukprot:scaffold388090_cov18-Prasinocladus_malaysianus.AAC.1
MINIESQMVQSIQTASIGKMNCGAFAALCVFVIGGLDCAVLGNSARPSRGCEVPTQHGNELDDIAHNCPYYP